MPDAKHLFLEALDRPEEERRAHVEQAAGADADLRERVFRLLDAHERAERDGPRPAENRPGDRIEVPPDVPHITIVEGAAYAVYLSSTPWTLPLAPAPAHINV